MIDIWVILKIPALILMAFYIVFAFVVVRQTKIMTDTLEIGFETPIKILAYMHFLFSVFLFIFALMTL